MIKLQTLLGFSIFAVLSFVCAIVIALFSFDKNSSSSVKNAIHLSAHSLSDLVQDDGSFIYRVNMNPDVKVKDKYNILRHAGAIYSLATYEQRFSDPEVKESLLKAGKFLHTAIRPVDEQNNILAIWSDPEINHSKNELQAKLGGTGISLLALMNLETISKNFTPIENLRGLGHFIVYMQKDDGSFYSKYFPSEKKRDDSWQSLYYPGEAILGLLMLYEQDPSDLWFNSAVKGLKYLATTRRHSIYIPADHWAVLATEKLFSLEAADRLSEEERELLIHHVDQISTSILNEQIISHENSDLVGGFVMDGRTTPTSTRLEALQAALNVLPDHSQTKKKLIKAIDLGISFLLKAQISQESYKGAYPRSVFYYLDEEAEGYNTRVSELRIDYTQHALSALLEYYARKESLLN